MIRFALALATWVAGCGGTVTHRFPLAEPMWVDDDMRAFSPPPEEYVSPFAWDGADQMIFRPLAMFFAARAVGEAVNVNAMDEVPDSSWFHNRVGRRAMSTDELVRAACDEPPLDPAGPFTVTDAKPNGANPGFIIRDPEGRPFLLKFDSEAQAERATAADVIGSILYWAAGYHTPCNRIVYFDRAVLRIGEGATAENAHGVEEPLTLAHIQTALDKGDSSRRPDGTYRGLSSRFLPGRPLGPWRYEGTRPGDPNDVVPHEDRRDLRGGYVLASWLNHFDSREQNTLSTWIAGDDGAGYVRHNYIDFGDSFGSLWEVQGISRRLGHAYYLDIPYLMEDLVTLGLVPRPWHSNRYGPAGADLGYYAVEGFVPDRWRPGYPNPAFGRATERDSAWMARILAHLREREIHAIVAEARIERDALREELARVLIGRRRLILERWFRTLSPLTHPRLEATDDGVRMCLRDLAVHAGLREARARRYEARAFSHDGRSVSPVPIAPPAASGERVCVALPRAAGEAYLIVDVGSLDEPGPARVHVHRISTTEYRVVGLERPEDATPPR